MPTDEPQLWSLRAFLILCLIADGVDPLQAQEVIDTTKLSHPDWDLTERRTFEEWMRVSASESERE